MKKLMVMMAAGASALALSADTWFADAVSSIDSWPTDGADKTLTDIGTWSGTSGATLDNSKLELDALDPLTFTAATKDLADGADAIQINTTMTFTPFATAPETVPDGAKAGVVLVGDSTNGYDFYVLGTDGEQEPANGFQIVSATHTATIPEDVAVVVSAVVDNGDLKVTYTIGENSPVTKTVVAANAQFSTAAFTGSGELSALAGAYTPTAPSTYTFTLDPVTGVESFVVSNADNTAEIAYDNGYTVEQGAKVNIYAIPAAGKFVSPASVEKTIGADGAIDLTGDLTITTCPVKIGTTYYLTFEKAFTEAVDGDTIVFNTDFTGVFTNGIFNTTDKFATDGLTIDLNGKTWTMQGGTNERAVEVYKGNKIKFTNGSLGFAAGSTNIAFYGYFEMLEFNSVALDFSNLFITTPSATDPRKNSAIVSQNGSVKFSGTTTVTLANGQTLVTMLDRASADYVPGTLTIDVNGTIPGDINLYSACGFVVGANTTLSGNVYTGAAAWSGFEAAGAAGSPYKAMVGAFIPATGSSSTNTRGGQLYTSVAAANAAIANTTYAKNVIVLNDATEDSFSLDSNTVNLEIVSNVTLTAATSLALNGAKVKLDEGGTLIAPAQLTIGSDFVAPAAGKEIVEAGSGPYTYTVANIPVYTVTYVVGNNQTQEQVLRGATPINVPTPETITGYEGAWDVTPGAAITADTTYTYTYTPINYTITYYNGDSTVSLQPATYDVTQNVTLPTTWEVVGVTLNGWTNELGQAVTGWNAGDKTGNITVYADVSAVAPAADWPADPSTVAGQAAGEVYPNLPTALENVDAGALATWAKAKGVAFSAQDTIKENAFLLDCANTDEAIASEQANFKASISVVNGVVTVTPANNSTYKNGKIVLQGRVSLTEGEWAAYDSATHKFARAVLVPATVQAK